MKTARLSINNHVINITICASRNIVRQLIIKLFGLQREVMNEKQ